MTSNSKEYMKSGKDLKRWREAQGLTQQELADKLDKCLSTISQNEGKNKISKELFDAWNKKFGK